MRFKVAPGAVVMLDARTLTAGEEFEATGDDAKQWESAGLVVRMDKPKGK